MKKVKIVEVGLRDGLQNESSVVSMKDRETLLHKLVDAGVKSFEVGSIVSPKWVPQMAVSENLTKKILKKYSNQKIYQSSLLVPNDVGMNRALATGIQEVAIFVSSTESFSKKNINCTIEESLQRYEKVMAIAHNNKIKVRGYLSVCFGCPFEGQVSEKVVVNLAQKLIEMGCYEISIGDTIGIAQVAQVESLFNKLLKVIPSKKIAGHFHDTRGQALANILRSYQLGITTFDSSIGGLGGCPYAQTEKGPSASGNVATEDVAFLFQGMSVQTGLDLVKLIKINTWLQTKINHPLPSKVGRIGLLS